MKKPPQLYNARKLRGISDIDPEDKEFKETIRNARKNGNTNGSSHALQDMQEKQACGDRSKTYDFKSKFACLLEANECARLRLGELLPTHQEDHTAGRGNNSLQL